MKKTMRLLVIEDEPDFATALARGLRDEGYAVDVTLDGESGCNLAMINDYDLLLLDFIFSLQILCKTL
jgi:DNA-binding response OmpR family regulator